MSRRRLLLAGGLVAIAAAVVLVMLAGLLVGLVDSDRPVRELALRDARAAADLDYAQVWRDSSPCFQRRVPEAEFVRQQEVPTAVSRRRAPGDTRYSVVEVRRDGAYRRVEVRVEAPGYSLIDYEIAVRQYGGRWVVVDRGSLGHLIEDDCQPGGGA